MPLQAPRPTHSPSTWDPPQNPSFRDPPPASITLPVAPHVSLSPSPHPGAVRAHPTLLSPQPASHRSLSNRHFLSGTQLPVSEQPQAHARPLALGGASGSGRAASLLVGIPGSPAVIGGRAPLWAWPCRRWGYIEVVRRRSAGLAGGCVAVGGFVLLASAAMRERRPPAAAPARCKLVLVGDVQCGKTAMLQVLAKDCYPEVSRGRYREGVPGAAAADGVGVGAVADVRTHRVRELHGVSEQRGAARGAEPMGHLRYRGGFGTGGRGVADPVPGGDGAVVVCGRWILGKAIWGPGSGGASWRALRYGGCCGVWGAAGGGGRGSPAVGGGGGSIWGGGG